MKIKSLRNYELFDIFSPENFCFPVRGFPGLFLGPFTGVTGPIPNQKIIDIFPIEDIFFPIRFSLMLEKAVDFFKDNKRERYHCNKVIRINV